MSRSKWWYVEAIALALTCSLVFFALAVWLMVHGLSVGRAIAYVYAITQGSIFLVFTGMICFDLVSRICNKDDNNEII